MMGSTALADALKDFGSKPEPATFADAFPAMAESDAFAMAPPDPGPGSSDKSCPIGKFLRLMHHAFFSAAWSGLPLRLVAARSSS